MKRIFKSISVAFFAQIISLILSVFMSFYVSKYMSVEGYGYYQLFLFYSTYVGILQFGASEGIYLSCGGKKYEEIDQNKVTLIFRNMFLLQMIFVTVFELLIWGINIDSNKKVVLSILMVYAIAYFLITFWGYLLQATNRVAEYSTAIIIGKGITLFFFITLVYKGIFSYSKYCMLYLFGYAASALFIIYRCRDAIFIGVKTKWILFKEGAILRSGCSLLFANLVSSFIVGINRVYIENQFGIAVFGKVSMALSLSNFIILFAIQIGLVIFPNIINLSLNKKKFVYKIIENLLGYIPFVIFIGYIPLKLILDIWIPQYSESVQWLIILVPYTTYEIKNQILYNTYMKAMRKEKYLFQTNVVALFTCAIVNLFVVYWLKSIMGVFIVLNIIIIGKSILLNKKINENLLLSNDLKNILEICGVVFLTFIYYMQGKYRIIWTLVMFTIQCLNLLVYERFSKKKCIAK